MMYKCYVCGLSLMLGMIKYHTADKTKVFCGAECSVKYHREQKEK